MFHSRRSFVLCLALAITLPAVSIFAQQPGANVSANDLMAQAMTQAAAENKNILITFGASWCVQCHHLDKFLTSSKVRPIIEKAFVLVDMNTGEHPGDTAHANIRDGSRWLGKMGGRSDSGYPFFAMADAKGQLIVNSIRPVKLKHGGNIGYPEDPLQIDWFMQMLQQAAPTLTPDELDTLKTRLTDRAKNFEK